MHVWSTSCSLKSCSAGRLWQKASPELGKRNSWVHVRREGWKALMAQQGFTPAVILGQDTPAPHLLSRQSVVLGVSDGAILVQPPPTKAAQLLATMPPLPAQLLGSFRELPLRNDLPPGGAFCIDHHCLALAAPVLRLIAADSRKS
jgi:hypothetical protein